jgi:hypothetical protein
MYNAERLMQNAERKMHRITQVVFALSVRHLALGV